MFYQIFLLPQMKQCAIITYKYDITYMRVVSQVTERLKT